MHSISSQQPAACQVSLQSLPGKMKQFGHIMLRRHDTPTRCRKIGCSPPPQAVQAGQPLYCRLLKLLKVLGMPGDDILVAPTPQIARGQRHAGQMPGAGRPLLVAGMA